MLSAEQFTTMFLQSLHGGGLPGFRRTCRSADLLVIDDIQFLVGKRATLVEFQQTVDALHRLGKQMVFACDRELDALDGEAIGSHHDRELANQVGLFVA
jgi:chromosomal replication initiator protein